MGNEIMSQNMINYGYSNPAMFNSFGGNMYGMGMGQFSGINDYSNDMFAPDFMKQPIYNYMGYTNTQQNVPSQNTQNQSIFSTQQNQTNQASMQTFTGNEQQTQLPQQDNKSIQPPKTNIGKTMGTVAGLSIPLISSATKVISGAKFSDVFKFKALGLKAAGLALAGWCAGALIDSLLNSYQPKAKA